MPDINKYRKINICYWDNGLSYYSFQVFDYINLTYNLSQICPILLHRALVNHGTVNGSSKLTVYDMDYWLHRIADLYIPNPAIHNALWVTEPSNIANTNNFKGNSVTPLWYDYSAGIVGVGRSYKSAKKIPIDRFVSMEENEVLSWANKVPVSLEVQSGFIRRSSDISQIEARFIDD